MQTAHPSNMDQTARISLRCIDFQKAPGPKTGRTAIPWRSAPSSLPETANRASAPPTTGDIKAPQTKRNPKNTPKTTFPKNQKQGETSSYRKYTANSKTTGTHNPKTRCITSHQRSQNRAAARNLERCLQRAAVLAQTTYANAEQRS
jgi:hypothetical protein